MDNLQVLLEQLLASKTYVQQGLQNITHEFNQFHQVIEFSKLPKYGWKDQSIEVFLQQLSLMDSNNFSSNAGVGEREGRIYSSMVARRNLYFSHGIGRSGDIVEVQPKAAGSSILYKLTNKLTTHALTIAGLSNKFSCVVFPLATGMSLGLCFNALKSTQPAEKRYVIWSRIDKKSCFKSILLANLIPIIVDPILVNGEMVTNIEEIRRLCQERKHEILAVFCTTSCFAPRQPDIVDKVAEICQEYDICHVINNAYGLQCETISKLINRAILKGRVDAGMPTPSVKPFLFSLMLNSSF
jgi:O-phospho-L-seryl-tRNASec:L-selenocysteinyl-tRNA synthase